MNPSLGGTEWIDRQTIEDDTEKEDLLYDVVDKSMMVVVIVPTFVLFKTLWFVTCKIMI